MRVHSTGLGKTEMVLKPESLSLKDGYLLFTCLSTEPVNWRIRILIEREDLARLAKLALKGTILLWFFSLLKKPAVAPDDY